MRLWPVKEILQGKHLIHFVTPEGCSTLFKLYTFPIDVSCSFVCLYAAAPYTCIFVLFHFTLYQVSKLDHLHLLHSSSSATTLWHIHHLCVSKMENKIRKTKFSTSPIATPLSEQHFLVQAPKRVLF